LRGGVRIPCKGDEELTKDIMLLALPRTVVGKKVKQIRREGWVPIVLYGPDFESEIFQANGFEIKRAVTAAGMTSLISLQVEGRQEPYKTLVRDVQRDLLTDALIHVDFYRVSMTQRITTEVPIELIGRTPLLAQGTVMLLTLMDRVEIECLPGDLVPSLELDVSLLQDIDDVLYVKDLSVPEGITILSNADGTVVRLAHATRLEEEVEEEEEVLPEEVAADGVEVIARGKTEEDED
jgi:large subunit ribosomal protein L25